MLALFSRSGLMRGRVLPPDASGTGPGTESGSPAVVMDPEVVEGRVLFVEARERELSLSSMTILGHVLGGGGERRAPDVRQVDAMSAEDTARGLDAAAVGGGPTDKFVDAGRSVVDPDAAAGPVPVGAKPEPEEYLPLTARREGADSGFHE